MQVSKDNEWVCITNRLYDFGEIQHLNFILGKFLDNEESMNFLNCSAR